MKISGVEANYFLLFYYSEPRKFTSLILSIKFVFQKYKGYICIYIVKGLIIVGNTRSC